jgi:hypothetical protein
MSYRGMVNCGFKHKYTTREAAVTAACAREKRLNISLKVYKCPHCFQYHLTKGKR